MQLFLSPIRSKLVLILAGIFVVILGLLLLRIYQLRASVKSHALYWQTLAAQPPKENALKLVALGDSTIQGIGAADPAQGVVGRAADYIRQQTGREVHITNLSRSGARIDEVVGTQLPKLKKLQPDAVIISVGANDATNSVDRAAFQAAYQTLIKNVPLERTIFADIPAVRNRNEYQAIFLDLARSNDVLVAPVYEAFAPHEREFSAYGTDLFHPSAKGYGYWFEAYMPPLQKILADRQLLKQKGVGN